VANAALNSSKNNGGGSPLGEMLPVDPFRSLFVHFGMLLGVEDFKTVESYHRGKMWLHSAWLHRAGTVWGLRVSRDGESGEVRVASGLAIDGLGRELLLEASACLNLPAWYEEHKDDAALQEIVEIDDASGEVRFDAHVVIRFKACLTRQVPALSEPCDGAGSTTAYSRVAESVELLLVPGKAPAWRQPSGSLPFHRLRLLFALEAPIDDDDGVVAADQDVLDAIADIQSKDPALRPAEYLKWFRHFSALDEMDLGPAAADENGYGNVLFPEQDPAPVILADIDRIVLSSGSDGWQVAVNAIDNSVRPVHLPTSTIQELLCHTPCCGAGEGAPQPLPPGETATDAGGPRVDVDSVAIEGEFITFNVVGQPLMKASVDVRAVSVTSFDVRDGWIDEDIKKVTYDAAQEQLSVELRDDPGGRLVRLIVKGTGPFPLLGRNRIPLAGKVGGQEVGSRIDGNDVTTMFKTRN